MADTAYISKKLAFNNAEQFKESFYEPEPATVGYVFLGNHIPWPNEDAPPEITDTTSHEKEIWDNMYAAKKITGNEVELVIPRVDWTGNTTYRAYDNTIQHDLLISSNVSQNLKPIYVMTSERNVYMCLSNNNSANSTVQPTGDYNSANGVISGLADGYVWKYMYNIKPTNRFLSNVWIPAPVSTAKLDYNVNPINVVDGALNEIIVTNNGSGYVTSTIPTTAYPAATNQITLSSITNVSANMTIRGAGIAPLTYITNISNTTNTVTISTSTLSANGGPGYDATISTRIYVTGDGSGFQVDPDDVILSGTGILRIVPTTPGSNYTHANVSIYGSGSGATARTIIAPKFGHGYNPAKELGASNVMVAMKIGQIDSTEGGLISNQTSFRQYGLLRDPYKYGTTTQVSKSTSNTVISQTTNLTVVAGSAYELNEYVYQGSANNASFKGYINDQTANGVRLSKVEGTITLGGALVGANSSTSRTVVKIDNPEFEPYTGDILYAENIQPTQRAEGQAENIRLVIKF